MSMELDNTFTVPVPPDVAWAVLLDVARIAPCMPGATVDEVDGDVVTGRIKIKLGPVTVTYRGTAKFSERDETAHTILVEASGKETRGAGTAAATIKASLEPADAGATLVTMHTSMNVTGRPAQLGRGMMAEVSAKLIDQFASNLAQQLAADEASADEAPADGAAVATSTAAAPAAPSVTDNGSAATATDHATSAAADATPVTAAASAQTTAAPGTPAPARQDSINVIRLVGPAILKRVLPVAAAAAAAALIGRKLRRTLRRDAKD